MASFSRPSLLFLLHTEKKKEKQAWGSFHPDHPGQVTLRVKLVSPLLSTIISSFCEILFFIRNGEKVTQIIHYKPKGYTQFTTLFKSQCNYTSASLCLEEWSIRVQILGTHIRWGIWWSSPRNSFERQTLNFLHSGDCLFLATHGPCPTFDIF